MLHGSKMLIITIGTYNNQYMVLDLKKVTLRKEIKDDAFWVVEQIPGLVYHMLA